MIIKEIYIRNFRSYYSDNTIKVSDGLTLIIGDNGDGKTTFFEALQWLFNTSEDHAYISNFSAMRKEELSPNEEDRVTVSMTFEHDGLKMVEKSFKVTRTGNGVDDYRVGKIEYMGYEEDGSERIPVNGKLMLERCFDAFIQRFSMFKGESDLNVFNNPKAFEDLVHKYSDLKDFDIYIPYADTCEKKSFSAYQAEMQSDKKNQAKAKSIEYRLSDCRQRISQYFNDIKSYEKSKNDYSARIASMEQNKDASEKLKTINERLEAKRTEQRRLTGLIKSVDLNTSLLDRFWILCAFPKILEELKDKQGKFSKTKRQMQEDFVRAQAKSDALEEIKAVLGGKPELRWDIPDQQTMEEMISEHVCKVCGTPAPEGSAAYNYMVKRLEAYKKHLEETIPVKKEEEVLFPKEYIEEIQSLYMELGGHNASFVTTKATEINERLELLQRFENQRREIENQIEEIEAEKTRLLIQTAGITEEELSKNFTDYTTYHRQMSNAEARITEYTQKYNDALKEEKDLKDEMDALASSGMAKVYSKAHTVFERIQEAFNRAKDTNLRNFLNALEGTANKYLERLNARDFHGVVRLIKTPTNSAEIRLFSVSGDEIVKPSGSQLTTMYMSVLFAISELTTLQKEENYPMIFDAATSSFGDTKEDDFYNIVDSLDKQCIIVTKDFLSHGVLQMDSIKHLTCNVYRISKEAGFDPQNLATIRTNIELVK
ncbi:MAG: AAA family ATPase [Bacteroidales bacterium]|nr:AAA family ATPase [Candidatus Cacconaster equi]